MPHLSFSGREGKRGEGRGREGKREGERGRECKREEERKREERIGQEGPRVRQRDKVRDACERVSEREEDNKPFIVPFIPSPHPTI